MWSLWETHLKVMLCLQYTKGKTCIVLNRLRKTDERGRLQTRHHFTHFTVPALNPQRVSGRVWREEMKGEGRRQGSEGRRHLVETCFINWWATHVMYIYYVGIWAFVGTLKCILFGVIWMKVNNIVTLFFIVIL